MFDDLEAFKNWWLQNRVINTPADAKLNHYNGVLGVVLFRQEPYQVQLFITPPNFVIEPHIHPDVDSYEVFVSGNIEFMCDGRWLIDRKDGSNRLGEHFRVSPQSWHGGNFGAEGGCFLSIQKWLNNVKPSSVGANWHDKQNNTAVTAQTIYPKG
jgi:hypothetical protein